MARDLARLRAGAEQGIAQVLTPAEMLALLDRLAALERATAALRTAARKWDADGIRDAIGALCNAVPDPDERRPNP